MQPVQAPSVQRDVTHPTEHHELAAAPATPTALADTSERTVRHGARFTEAASRLYNGLQEPQRREAVFPYGGAAQRRWQYTPNPSGLVGWTHALPHHQGTSIARLSTEQQQQLEAFLQLALSGTGRDNLDAARTLDANDTLAFRGMRDWLLFDYSPDNYFVSFFGTPGDERWGVRLEGHHASYTFEARGDDITTSSVFVGTTLAEVQVGDRAVRPLADVVTEATQLATSLDPVQRAKAGRSLRDVPSELLYAPSAKSGTMPDLTAPRPTGLRYDDMRPQQQTALREVLRRYQAVLPDGVAARNLEAAAANDYRDVQLVWAGDHGGQELFYFRIQGERFVLELGCSEDSPQHYHAAWSRTR